MRFVQLQELRFMRTLANLIASTLAVLILLLLPTDALAQTATTGALIIRVKDTADLAIPNVMLSISSANLIRSQSATTDKDGHVRIGNLPPGRYTVLAHITPGVLSTEVQVDVSIARTSSITFDVRWRSEGKSTLVKNRPLISPRMTPTANLFVASRPVVRTTTSEKLAAPVSENNVRQPPKTERNPADRGNSSMDKTFVRAATTPTALTDRNAGLSRTSEDLTQIYKVGVGDVVDIRIISTTPTDRSTLFTVTSHGLLEHPKFDKPLKVLGLTTDEISNRIEAELKRKAISQNPTVLVAVREYVSHTIIVSGLVKDPGTKILRREAIPLYVILADAQPVAEAGRVSVVSKATNEITTIELSDPKALTLTVCSGDVVNVHVTPKQYFYIGGDVKAPGEKPFRSGLTLTQAILAAGGLSTKAAAEVQVARAGPNDRLVLTRYKLDEINSGKLPDPVLQQGDRITVVH